MALDGIFLSHLVKEIEEKIINSRVEHIWSNDLYYVFQTYKEGQRTYLTFNLHAGFTSMYLAQNPVEKFGQTHFLSILRKHLLGGIISKIEQYKSDRIVTIYFTVYDIISGPIEKKLIFEAMGRYANLILVQEHKIIDLHKRSFVLEGRHLIPNATYTTFLSDKADAHTYQFNPHLSPKELTEHYLGISLRLAKYLSVNSIHPYDIKVEPTLALDENKAYFFNLFEGNTISYPSLSLALENRIMDRKDEKQPLKTFMSQQQKRLKRKYEQLNKQIFDAEVLLQSKSKADQIYASLLDLNQHKASLNDFALDPTKTLNENAQFFYQQYAKAKRALGHLDQVIAEVVSEQAIFQSFQEELALATNDDLPDFKELLKPFGYTDKSAHKHLRKRKIHLLTIHQHETTYFIGKNSYQNGYLINEIGHKDDYWFHVQNSSGSHVLVRTQDLNEHVIRTAAQLAGYFSPLKQSSSIPVIYTRFKYVQKISGKPASFVKVKNEKTIFIDIDPSYLDSLIHNA